MGYFEIMEGFKKIDMEEAKVDMELQKLLEKAKNYGDHCVCGKTEGQAEVFDIFYGLEITKISVEAEKFTLYVKKGPIEFAISLEHIQDCCEYVWLEDITGDPSSLIGGKIAMFEQVRETNDEGYFSSTWSFFKISTEKANVTLRFIGESNGYYSEAVYVMVIP